MFLTPGQIKKGQLRKKTNKNEKGKKRQIKKDKNNKGKMKKERKKRGQIKKANEKGQRTNWRQGEKMQKGETKKG